MVIFRFLLIFLLAALILSVAQPAYSQQSDLEKAKALNQQVIKLHNQGRYQFLSAHLFDSSLFVGILPSLFGLPKVDGFGSSSSSRFSALSPSLIRVHMTISLIAWLFPFQGSVSVPPGREVVLHLLMFFFGNLSFRVTFLENG